MLKNVLLVFGFLPVVLHAAQEEPTTVTPETPVAVMAEKSGTESVEEAHNDNGWSGEGELGYTSTSGNTDSESLNASLEIARESGKWKHTASLETIKTTTDNVTSADSAVFKEKTEYQFGQKSYAFGKVRYEEDEFSGYDYQASLSFGVGSQFVKTERHSLDASIGLGYRGIKDTLTQEIDQEGIVAGDADYKYIISKSASFTEALSFEAGDENTYTESETALKTRINSHLASKITYLVKHNTDVPVGTEKTDKILTVSLLYNF